MDGSIEILTNSFTFGCRNVHFFLIVSIQESISVDENDRLRDFFHQVFGRMSNHNGICYIHRGYIYLIYDHFQFNVVLSKSGPGIFMAFPVAFLLLLLFILPRQIDPALYLLLIVKPRQVLLKGLILGSALFHEVEILYFRLEKTMITSYLD